MTSIAVAAYIALFMGVGAAFLFVSLLVGRFLRSSDLHAEKQEIYECGEPTIGSSYVQFDLRFYVVALLFLIFDVEVAFFFPWATVFGKANALRDDRLYAVQAGAPPAVQAQQIARRDRAVRGLYAELGVPRAAQPDPSLKDAITGSASQLALFSMLDIAAFFAVVLVGFAYVWHRGDLDWVRAMSRERGARAPPDEMAEEKAAA
ncbi:MAG: NADH-quinone oxidoreductase subunit A [Planctomycetia bacterium]|nr:NADH-quinone oxidoreductase subunit A [Planctomycetia bacterium]